jgi:hypothetical protein
MSRKKAGRLSLLVLVAGLWMASPVQAVRPPAIQASLNLWQQIWETWQAIWQPNGCDIDPYGRCIAAPESPAAPDQLDNGCSIDPLGQCAK